MEPVVIVEVLDDAGTVGQRIRIDRWPATVGRAYRADVLLDDPYVSPEHLRLTNADGAGVLVEDLASLNGLYMSDGRRVAQATATPGSVMRVGHTKLRFCLGDQAVPPALVDDAASQGVPSVARAAIVTPVPDSAASGELSATATASLATTSLSDPSPVMPRIAAAEGPPTIALRVTSPWRAAAIVVAAFAIVALNGYLTSYERNGGTGAVAAALGVLFLIAMWAGAWAFAGRVIVHRARFLGHLALASLIAVASVALSEAEAWLSFLYPGASAGDLLTGAGYALALVVLIAGHLALATRVPSSGRWRIAGLVTGALVAVSLFIGYAESKKFSTKLEYPASMRPFPVALVPATSVAHFITSTRPLQRQVDSLAAEH